MQKEFKFASVIPLRLQPLIQEILNDKNYKPSPAVRDLLSKFPVASSDTADEIKEQALGVIAKAQLIEEIGNSYFYYRQGKISPNIFYSIIARNSILQTPSLFPNLSDDYTELEADLKKLISSSAKMNDPSISTEAKFCYGVNVFIALQDFAESLRTGELLPSHDLTREIYDEVVGPALPLAGNYDDMASSIGTAIKKINFILNHHENEFYDLCSFIDYGIGKTDINFSEDQLFGLLPCTPTKNTKNIFSLSYGVFAEQYQYTDQEFFYEVSEKIFGPVKLLHMAAPDINPICFDYLIAHAAIIESEASEEVISSFGKSIEDLYKASVSNKSCNDVFERFKISKNDLQSMSACIAISELALMTFKMKGPHLEPLYDGDEIVQLYDLLELAEEMETQNSFLKNALEESKAFANGHLKEFFEKFPRVAGELDLQPRI